MLLSLEKVSKVYGDRLIFKGISFGLEPGAVMLLTGPNGAGKSTLLKIVAGLSAPSGGKIRLCLPDSSAPGAGQIGYMGHQTFIYPQLSAFENLLFWNRLHGLDCAAPFIEAALERVELKRFAHERAGNFSRGMAQRLNLARVLMQEPALLLLDEPSTGLDARSRELLRDEIGAAKDRGAAVIWITHTVGEDISRADLVAELPGPPVKRREKGGGTAKDFFVGSPREYLERSEASAASGVDESVGGASSAAGADGNGISASRPESGHA